MRGLVLRLLRALVRLFYRRIETSGLAAVPPEGPVLLIANHPNGLVDPMLVLAVLPRPVVFVAKSTLWKIPLLRRLLDLLECVPVVRRHEAEAEGVPGTPERNEESFRKLASVLDAGGAVLIFPEGRSHSDPRLSHLRTGAARVLLHATTPPPVVPLGVWFTKKEEFRSEVLLRFGAPVEPPPAPGVESWTEAMGRALEGVTLNADDWKDHEMAAAVDAVYGARLAEEFLEGDESRATLERSVEVRQLLLAARPVLESRHAAEVATVVRRARAFERLLRRASLSPAALDDPPPAGTVLKQTLRALAVLLLGLPVAVLGIAAFWVPYRLTGVAASRAGGAAKETDQIALHKLVAGCLLFPCFWLAETAVLLVFGGPAWALAGAILLPAAGLATLPYIEYEAWRERQARELLALLLRPRNLARLRAERDALVAECDRLAAIRVSEGADRAPETGPDERRGV